MSDSTYVLNNRELVQFFQYFHDYSGVLGKHIITSNEYDKTSTDSASNLLNKAERQTIEVFQEKGVWKIGVKR